MPRSIPRAPSYSSFGCFHFHTQKTSTCNNKKTSFPFVLFFTCTRNLKKRLLVFVLQASLLLPSPFKKSQKTTAAPLRPKKKTCAAPSATDQNGPICVPRRAPPPSRSRHLLVTVARRIRSCCSRRFARPHPLQQAIYAARTPCRPRAPSFLAARASSVTPRRRALRCSPSFIYPCLSQN